MEKAGIIKRDIPVVIGTCTPETRNVFQSVARECFAPIYFSEEPLIKSEYSLPLGKYQRFNEQTVLKSVEVLRKKFWKISSKSLINGLNNVIKNTSFRGRWELLSHSPLVICDTAHNEDGIRIVSEQLTEQPSKQLRLVLGFVLGKKIEKMLSFFPENAIYYFCQPSIDRAFPIEKLRELTKNLYKSVYYFDNVKKALSQAKKDAHKRDLIFVGGSTFVVSDVL